MRLLGYEDRASRHETTIETWSPQPVPPRSLSSVLVEVFLGLLCLVVLRIDRNRLVSRGSIE